MRVNISYPPNPGLTLLVLAPTNSLDPLAPDSELARLKESIGDLARVDALIGRILQTELSDALQDLNPAGLHVMAHGNEQMISLGDTAITGKQLGRLLSQHHVTLMIAMTCQSESLRNDLLSSGLSHLIAAQDLLDDETARQFTRHFYRALSRDLDVPAAFAFAMSRLPDDQQDSLKLYRVVPQPEDPLMAQLRAVLQRLNDHDQTTAASHAELRVSLQRLNRDTRSLTGAVIKLAEVLSRAPENEDSNGRPTTPQTRH